MRNLSSLYEILDSNLIITDVPKKKKKRWFEIYMLLLNKVLNLKFYK